MVATPTVRVVGNDARRVARLRSAGWRVGGDPDADAIVLLDADPARVRAERTRGRGALVVVADVDLAERHAALAAGADDVLHPATVDHELAARLDVLVHARPDRPEVLVAGDLRVDLGARTALRGGRRLDLGPREFELLTFLLRNRGIVVSRTAIVEHVWGGASPPASESAVAVLVLRLRRKLEAGGEPRVLRTVRGWGYVMRA